MKLSARKRLGFSLIELIVVVGIVAFVSSFGFLLYQDYTRHQTVIQAAEKARTTLLRIRQKALSGEIPTGCIGLFLGYQFSCSSGSGNYTIKAVCSSSTPTTDSVDLPGGVTFSACQTFQFNVLNAGTNLAADQTISIAGFSGVSASFVVKKSGVVQ